MADLKISQLTGATTPLAGTEVLPVVQSGTTKKVSVANLTTGRTVLGLGFTALAPYTEGVSSAGGVLSTGTNSNSPAKIYGYQNSYSDNIGIRVAPFIPSVGNADTVEFDTDRNIKILTAAKGVNFTANTPAVGMTSQLLNWYEEGTWTPVVVGSSTAGTATYSFQNGRYTRIGRQVFIELFVVYSGGTGTGSLTITGLPFTASNAAVYPGLAIGGIENIVLTAGATPMAYVDNNSSRIFIQQIPSGGGTASLVAYDAAGSIGIAGSYSI